MFELHRVTKAFTVAQQPHLVMQDVSCRFDSANSYAIMGPSGVGKSTLLHLLIGLEQATAGNIFFNGADVGQMARADATTYGDFLCKDIGMVFQKPCLVPELNVLENVMIKGLMAKIALPLLQERAREVLALVGLQGLEERSVDTLSGGQQQRLSLARALLLRPKFLLLDEATAHVDHATTDDIITILKTLQRDHGVGIVMITHDLRVAQAMDHSIYMNNRTLHNQPKEGRA